MKQNKKPWGALLITDGIGFKTRAITRDNEGLSNSSSGYLSEVT